MESVTKTHAEKVAASVAASTASAPRVAIIDDDALVRRLEEVWLTDAGVSVQTFTTGGAALAAIDSTFDAIVVDLGLEDMPGLHVVEHLRARGIDAPIVVVTAAREIETAVAAMRAGAYDYMTKPIDGPRLVAAVKRASERQVLARRVAGLQKELEAQRPSRSLVGDSAAMRAVSEQIERIKDSDVTVCILGESGTGKEVVARAIHESGKRLKGPFVAINCGAIPAALQESELFGHERGAFTGAANQHKGRFEQARGGTLFLDELGEMSPATQAALLRTLQERTIRRVGGTVDVPIDVRILCATHRDLEAEVRAGRFREDLYFRLFVFPIRLPALRDRRDDLPMLVTHLLKRLSVETGRRVDRVAPDALEAMTRHAWPGNVRELQNVLHRAVLSCDGDEIRLRDLPAELRTTMLPALPLGVGDDAIHHRLDGTIAAAPPIDDDGSVCLRELERRAIERALKRSNGRVEQAAKLLGIGRATLYRRLAEVS